jgi:two-component system response regulator AtoC
MPLRTPTSDPLPPLNVIFGESSPAMLRIRKQLDRIAQADFPVLIHGESGTGKDILARLFHQLSPWRSGPFVKINCPAIPDSLLESELFGYERGAFTGANTVKPGRVEMAHRGTLFLDEISEIGIGLQSKLLQLLQDGQFCRVGAQEDQKVEVRVICATNRQLEKEIEKGNFRSDLFYRINVLNIHVPPLRQRPNDIPMLVNYFIELYNEKYSATAANLNPSTMRKLQAYSWPGNIRELENVVKRYIILGSKSVFDELPDQQSSANPALALLIPPEIAQGSSISLKKLARDLVRELEIQVIPKSLQAHGWNRKQTARALKISYRALLYKIRDFGLSPPADLSPSASPPEPDSDDVDEVEDVSEEALPVSPARPA